MRRCRFGGSFSDVITFQTDTLYIENNIALFHLIPMPTGPFLIECMLGTARII